MELARSAIGAAAPDPAATSAADVLAALPQPAAAPPSGQMQILQRCQSMSTRRHSLTDAPGYCALLCEGMALVSARPVSRVDSAGKPACELCGRRLADVKHIHRHGPGHACHPRCKTGRHRGDSTAAPAGTATAPKQSRKRRAQSDPGELRTPSPPRVRSITPRVTAPMPAAAATTGPRSTRQEERIMRMLDETVARREAWLAAQGQAPLAHL